MRRTLGSLIHDRDEFFYTIGSAWASINVLNLAFESGLVDRLSHAPVELAALAGDLGLPPDKLRRLVSFLAAHELVRLEAEQVSAIPATEHLRQAESMVRNAKISMVAASSLYEGLSKGITPFEAHFGQPVFDYFAGHPEAAAHFAGFMAYLTRKVESFVFEEHRFAPFELAVDVGGSHGGLLLRLLRDHPNARGILFDLPHVADSVREAVRSAPGGERVEVVGGSFFDAMPEGDLYLVKMVLHDWDDDASTAVLRRIREAMRPGGRVTVIEHIMPERPEAGESLIFDLAMMVWDTGKERTLAEYEALLAASGLRLERVTANPCGQSVIEAVAA